MSLCLDQLKYISHYGPFAFSKIIPSSCLGEGGDWDDMTLSKAEEDGSGYKMLWLICVAAMEWPSRTDLSLVTSVVWLVPPDFCRDMKKLHTNEQSPLFASDFNFLHP